MNAPSMNRNGRHKKVASIRRYSEDIRQLIIAAGFPPLLTMKKITKSSDRGIDDATPVSPEAVGEKPNSPYPLVLERRHSHDVDAEILAHLDEVRRLAHKSMCAQEDQRRQVSRELHDNIAQILCAATNRITLAQDHKIPAWLRQELLDLREQLGAALEDVRMLARDLRPHLLDSTGFTAALDRHVGELRERSGITIDVRADPDIGTRFGKHELTHIFRLIQEALRNVEDHSGASQAHIRLEASDGVIHLEIGDNGCSFTPERVIEAQRDGHLGLLGMRERSELLGGSFTLEAKPRLGTTIKVFIPQKKEKP